MTSVTALMNLNVIGQTFSQKQLPTKLRNSRLNISYHLDTADETAKWDLY
jgi:hypothetical protein